MTHTRTHTHTHHESPNVQNANIMRNEAHYLYSTLDIVHSLFVNAIVGVAASQMSYF